MDAETALAIIEEDYDEGEYQIIEGHVDDGHHKHDRTDYYSIVLRKVDSTYWKVCYTQSYEHGLDDGSVYVYPVEKKEAVKTIWVAKK